MSSPLTALIILLSLSIERVPEATCYIPPVPFSCTVIGAKIPHVFGTSCLGNIPTVKDELHTFNPLWLSPKLSRGDS